VGDEDNDDEDNSENDDDDDENEGDEDEDDDDDNGSQKSKRSYNLRANKPRTHFYNVPVVGKALCTSILPEVPLAYIIWAPYLVKLLFNFITGSKRKKCIYKVCSEYKLLCISEANQ